MNGVAIFLLAAVVSVFQSADDATRKRVLILFSGSDWCPVCRRFETNVMNSPAFKEFVIKEVEFVIADFPQKVKQDEAIVKRNEALAEKYNPNGMFPAFVLIQKDSVSRTEDVSFFMYKNETPEAFIAIIRSKMKK